MNIIRDTGCSCIIVNNNSVEMGNLINEYSLLKMAGKNVFKVQRAILEIESPYYAGKTL